MTFLLCIDVPNEQNFIIVQDILEILKQTEQILSKQVNFFAPSAFQDLPISICRRPATLVVAKQVSNKNGVFNLNSHSLLHQPHASYTSLVFPSCIKWSNQSLKFLKCGQLLEPGTFCNEQIRTVIKYSLKKGRRKSVKAVRTRFMRLNWGIWIRTIAGRYKKLWKKSARRRNKLSEHVFCNATQSKMLDKMVNKFWRKPRYYIDDPYAPYHRREHFYGTRLKPWRPLGVDYE